jgi:3-dehydroquinate synthase
MYGTVPIAIPNKPYNVHVGNDVIAAANLAPFVTGRQVAIISNPTVFKLFGQKLKEVIDPLAEKLIEIELPDGEAYKTWETLNLIFDGLLANKFDRRCLLIALGGGVVGDMTGFAAASYQRGVDFIQIPTTLLAQVDSSVGGKTGINHPAGKNMIGAFHQPKLVIADVGTLASLPRRELAAGLAEIIKHGAITDTAYLDTVADQMPQLLAMEPKSMAQVVQRSIEIKAAVVIADERETGVRATLNFGHTFGHAIESGLGYGEWLHGEAVGAGMVMAADLSWRLGLLPAADMEHLIEIIASAGLPIKAPAWSPDRYIELMSVDKKAQSGVLKFVLLDGLGKAISTKVDAAALKATLIARSR